jgi:hypothetical protein
MKGKTVLFTGASTTISLAPRRAGSIPAYRQSNRSAPQPWAAGIAAAKSEGR